MELGQSTSQSISNNMGQTKKTYEQMTLDEMIAEMYQQFEEDADYQYQLYKERQLEAMNEAYEQHLADKY